MIGKLIRFFVDAFEAEAAPSKYRIHLVVPPDSVGVEVE